MKSFALAICLLLLGGTAQAQTPAPCPNQHSHEFDFWIGTWNVTVRQHWQVSKDAGESWQDAFDGLYTKQKPAAAPADSSSN